MTNPAHSPPAIDVDPILLDAASAARAGDLQRAVARTRDALAIDPHNAPAHFLLAQLALQVTQAMAALPHFRAALQGNPHHGGYWTGYIDGLIRAGQWEPARQMLLQARQRGLPDTQAGPLESALAMAATGRMQPGPQRTAHSNAAVPAVNIATLEAMAAAGRHEEMETLAGQLTMAFPHDGLAWKALGTAMTQQHAHAEAIAPLRLAASLLPQDAAVQNNLGNALCEVGQFDAAAKSYRRALLLQPDFPLAFSNLLFMLNYSAAADKSSCLDEARAYGRLLEKDAGRKFTSWPTPAQSAPLRVGLVSGDLRNHPVGYFLEALLQHTNPAAIEFFAYTTNPPLSSAAADPLSARIRPRFRQWQSIAQLDDQAAAALIHADGLHILIDLAGHTAANRLPVFAARPAPVQVSWLGYFATTGVAAIDYLLADETGVPPDSVAVHDQFTEQIVYLPGTRLCFTAPADDVNVTPLPALANGHVTFGCFQHLPKVGDNVLAVWGRIFAALPDARLHWQCRPLASPEVCAEVAARMARHGIDPARVSMGPAVPRRQYLEAHGGIDMILDTFPYPGGTTTCEALWMGVPTLTLAGDRMLSRQGASLLAAAGLPAWIADSEDQYVEMAVGWARNLPGLSALRSGLRRQVLQSPLFDAAAFARNFDATMRRIWSMHSNGR